MGATDMTCRMNAGILASAAVAAGPVFGAEETKTIALPPPRSKGGKPLIEALALRRSTREYASPVVAATDPVGPLMGGIRHQSSQW